MTLSREQPGPGQESVWDYPRPPRVELSQDHVRIVVAGHTVAESTATVRVLETSHPPVYYIPPDNVNLSCLLPASGQSWCEWKGVARYYDVRVGSTLIRKAGWSYPDPTSLANGIRDYVAFYPGKVEACFVNDEQVTAQPGDFYGGWITSKIVGPFKGGPGTRGW